MLSELFPRGYPRYASLPVLGECLDGFVVWLRGQGYPLLPIRLRIRATPRLDDLLRRCGVRRPSEISSAALLRCVPTDSQNDHYLGAVVRSLVRYLDERGVFLLPPTTPAGMLVASYRAYLQMARGLSAPTVAHHSRTVAEFIAFLDYDHHPDRLRQLDQAKVEDFLLVLRTRLARASLQHSVAHLRSFLRFLAGQALVRPGLDSQLDAPRLYRGERLPRALSWETVRALLSAIDRSTPTGRRNYAMLLLVATYGLRSSEVVALTLEDVEWRAARLRVQRPKVSAPLLLPLTPEVGGALLDYLRHGRPELPYREIFLRVRAPAGTLKRTALWGAFQRSVRSSGLSVPFQGSHCLRHSLAVHLLRQGTPLKTIGDLLGHRSAESTCVYLRLHIEDLRDVALQLPAEARAEVRR